MTLADRIAAKIAAVRPKIEDAALWDTCEILRASSAGVDEFGSDLPPTTAVVATERCALRDIANQGGERLIADRLGWTSAYAIDLGLQTVVTREDTIRVNGARTFHVGDIKREAAGGVLAKAIVEERG